MSLSESIEKRAAQFAERYKAVYKQLGRVIVGHNDIVHGVLTCLFVGGHCLLEGVPGLGKTLLVRTLAQTLERAVSVTARPPPHVASSRSACNHLPACPQACTGAPW